MTDNLDLTGFPPLQTTELTVVTIVVDPEPSRFFVLRETSQGWVETGKTYQTFILSDVELGRRFPTVWEEVMAGGALTQYRFQTQDFGVWKFFRRVVFEIDRKAWEAQAVPTGVQDRIKAFVRTDESS